MERIAIIGAGISGISAAYELKKRGYENVVVLEKENRIGGKCSTVDIDGKNYEMGAMICGISYVNILEMAKDTGFTPRPMKKAGIADTSTGKYLSVFAMLKLYFTIILSLTWTVIPEFKKYIYPKTGYEGIDKEALSEKFEKWLERKKLTKYRECLALYYTTWGYGYFDDSPLLYVRKFLDPERLMRVLVKQPISKTHMFQLYEGYQTMIEKIVEKHKIKIEKAVTIKAVERKKGKIIIKTDKGVKEFDKIVLACPLTKALKFMDVSKEEKEIMSKIKTRDVYSYTCEVDKLPNVEVSLAKNEMTIDRAGFPTGWYRRWLDTNICTFYIDNAHGQSKEKLYENLKNSIEKFGCKVIKQIRCDNWEYSPHVDPEEIKNGFYDKMENLQGQKNTFYCGEIVAFPTVEFCSEYAREMIKKNFEIAK